MLRRGWIVRRLRGLSPVSARCRIGRQNAPLVLSGRPRYWYHVDGLALGRGVDFPGRKRCWSGLRVFHGNRRIPFRIGFGMARLLETRWNAGKGVGHEKDDPHFRASCRLPFPVRGRERGRCLPSQPERHALSDLSHHAAMLYRGGLALFLFPMALYVKMRCFLQRRCRRASFPARRSTA